ncbi:ATP-dependent nuclease [Hyphomonas sp. NPDC076900]|uniref:ATP-dependent nuclease n=1 Tax=unclassified Hyphomonas TaxID=2630699 RepID=UPI003D017C7E
MFLSHIEIRNFRGIEELVLELDDVCVLIGENNAGKSSVLDALRLCLTRSLTRKGSVFEEYDYHLSDGVSEPSKAAPIEILLRFREQSEDEWPDEISQQLSDAEQVDSEGLRSVTLRVRSGFDAVIGDFATEYDFLDLAGNPLIKAKNPRHIINLQQLVPTFYLASLRDAAQEFRARSSFWGPFVRSMQLEEDDRNELEAALSDLNKKVLEKHTAFETVKERLEKTAKLVPLGETEPVSIEALPSKIFDILSRTQVNLASKTGARIPIMRHGNGTQSLAVICLFDAFLQSQLEDGYGEHAVPLLALEEPEAHLHPSAIKAVGEMLRALSGQKLISTHSGELLAGVPLSKIRRLCRKDGKVCVHRISQGVLTDEEIGKLDYKVRTTRGSLLFSRCWLLVEGETEASLIPECATAMGIDLYAEGVSCIEFSQVGVEKFIKLADQLGIDWMVMCDGDAEGQKYADTAKGQLNGRVEADHVWRLPNDNMEVFLCVSGFGDIYEANISDQKKNTVTSPVGTVPYWTEVAKAQARNSKPKSALEVSQRMLAGSADVPDFLKSVISKAHAFARSAA